jgi:hypothetical protein
LKGLCKTRGGTILDMREDGAKKWVCVRSQSEYLIFGFDMIDVTGALAAHPFPIRFAPNACGRIDDIQALFIYRKRGEHSHPVPYFS